MGRTLQFVIGAVLLILVAGIVFRVLFRFALLAAVVVVGLYLVGALGNKRGRR
ncbi:MAG TPA: hypothetical protein VGE07_27100 [Herpetosiphonaceae bacterium]